MFMNFLGIYVAYFKCFIAAIWIVKAFLSLMQDRSSHNHLHILYSEFRFNDNIKDLNHLGSILLNTVKSYSSSGLISLV